MRGVRQRHWGFAKVVPSALDSRQLKIYFQNEESPALFVRVLGRLNELRLQLAERMREARDLSIRSDSLPRSKLGPDFDLFTSVHEN